MKNYQTLALIGGIFGIVLTPIALLLFGLTGAIMSPYDDLDMSAGDWGEYTGIALVVSIGVSIVAIVASFVTKNTKAAGIVLICSGVIMLPVTHVTGAVSWVLFIVGGVLAIRAKPDVVEQN